MSSSWEGYTQKFSSLSIAIYIHIYIHRCYMIISLIHPIHFFFPHVSLPVFRGCLWDKIVSKFMAEETPHLLQNLHQNFPIVKWADSFSYNMHLPTNRILREKSKGGSNRFASISWFWQLVFFTSFSLGLGIWRSFFSHPFFLMRSTGSNGHCKRQRLWRKPGESCFDGVFPPAIMEKQVI